MKRNKKEIKGISLKTQLIIVLIVLSVLPVVFIGMFAYMNTLRQINLERNNNLDSYSQMILNNVETRLDSAQSILDGLSNNRDLIDNLRDFNTYSKANNSTSYYAIQMQLQSIIRDSKRNYETVNVADISGSTVMDGSKYSDYYLGKSFYEMSFFDYIKQSGSMFIGNPVTSEATGKLLLPISKSIKSTEGFIGVATVMLDISEFSRQFDKMNFGKTSNIEIINDRNIILYATDRKLNNSKNKIGVLEKIVTDKGNIHGSVKYQSEESVKVISYSKLAKTGWIVCAQLDESELVGPAKRLGFMIICTLIVLIGLAAFISIMFSRHISKPVISLIRAMKRVEKGDLNVNSIPETNIRELNDLGSGFSKMVGNLKCLINNVIDASTRINSSSLSMTSASQSSLSYAENTIEDILDITKSVKDQANGTGVILKGFEGLSGRINTAKVLSEEISCFTGAVDASAENGLRLVKVLKEKADENTANTRSVGKVIKMFNEEMKEINLMAQTIENIAKKTKLLSLNAAIEAARSGEAGRGFSVVADEIKNLSEQTAKETSEINSLTEKLREHTLELVENMGNANAAVNDQNKAVVQTEMAFGDIYKNIKDISSKISNITVYLEEMNGDKEGIIRLVREINHASGEVAANSERVKDFANNQINMVKAIHESSEALNELSNNLSGSVDLFKI